MIYGVVCKKENYIFFDFVYLPFFTCKFALKTTKLTLEDTRKSAALRAAFS